MGRPKDVFPDLPPRMTSRKLKSGKVLYYYQAGRKKVPLGPDLGRARTEWAILENSMLPNYAFASIVEDWRRTELAKRSYRTQKGYECYLKPLLDAFGHLPFEAIRTDLIQEYIDSRSAKISANREVGLLSTIWKWAKRKRKTEATPQLWGIERNRERARRRYVTDEEYQAAWDRATPWLQDAMDLAVLTGQRVGDILKMTRADIHDGCLWVVQAKTGTKMGIQVAGQLQDVLERILKRPRAISSVYLVADDKGQKITSYRLWSAFQYAKDGADWRFHDLRAKVASDLEDMRHAQNLLGHSNETTTARVYRRVRGTVVKAAK